MQAVVKQVLHLRLPNARVPLSILTTLLLPLMLPLCRLICPHSFKSAVPSIFGFIQLYGQVLLKHFSWSVKCFCFTHVFTVAPVALATQHRIHYEGKKDVKKSEANPKNRPSQ